jgi:mannose-6-phosphate isomerase class I
MTFRLYDWGREKDPMTARPMHLEEAIDIIDYKPYDMCKYRKGPLWGEEASYDPCCSHQDHCCDHDHEHEHHAHEGQTVETLLESPQFTVSKLNLTDPLHIYTEQFGSFIVYVCVEGAASIQVPSTSLKNFVVMFRAVPASTVSFIAIASTEAELKIIKKASISATSFLAFVICFYFLLENLSLSPLVLALGCLQAGKPPADIHFFKINSK